MGTEFIIYRLCGTVMIEDEKMIQEQLEEIEADISD